MHKLLYKTGKTSDFPKRLSSPVLSVAFVLKLLCHKQYKIRMSKSECQFVSNTEGIEGTPI